MSWLRVLGCRIRGLFVKRRLERDLDDELRAHIEMLTEENLRKGMSPKEARFAAQRAFWRHRASEGNLSRAARASAC
jgi:hypothetical protein